MPIYTRNGKRYNVPESRAAAFEASFGDAEREYSTIDKEGKSHSYSVPVGRAAAFEDYLDKKGETWGGASQEAGKAANATRRETPSGELAKSTAKPTVPPDDEPAAPDGLFDAVNQKYERVAAWGKKAVEGLFDGTLRKEADPITGVRLTATQEELEAERKAEEERRRREAALAGAQMKADAQRRRDSGDMSPELWGDRPEWVELQEKKERAKKRREQLETLRTEVQKKGGTTSSNILSMFSFLSLPHEADPGINAKQNVLAQDRFAKIYEATKNEIDREEEYAKWNYEKARGHNRTAFGTFLKTAFDVDTWNAGMTDLQTSAGLYNTLDKDLTVEEQVARHILYDASAGASEQEEEYRKKQTVWEKGGEMTGEMLPFMVDFVAVSHGGGDAIRGGAKLATKGATKLIGKEAAENIGKQGVTNYIKSNGWKALVSDKDAMTYYGLKFLGTSADDIARAAVMTNTVQGTRTAADIMSRDLGTVQADEHGRLALQGGDGLGRAIWQGEANAIVENYSEMFGSSVMDKLPIGSALLRLGRESKLGQRLGNTFGAKNVSRWLRQSDAQGVANMYHGMEKAFSKLGVSDFFGEVAEEYVGQVARTALNLDDAYIYNEDGTRTNAMSSLDWHGDLWSGMAISMGMMNGFKGSFSVAGYANARNKASRSSKRAEETFSEGTWKPLRALIDCSDNDNIGDVTNAIMEDKTLTDDERMAALDYITKISVVRGWNLASMSQGNRGRTPEETSAEREWLSGYNAVKEDEITAAVSLYHEEEQEAKDYGMLESLQSEDETARQSFFDGLREAASKPDATEEDKNRYATALAYYNAAAYVNGLSERVEHSIANRRASADGFVNARRDRNGNIVRAKDKDGNTVYVRKGKIAMDADGNMSYPASDKSVLVVGERGADARIVSTRELTEIEQPVSVEDELRFRYEEIEQEARAAYGQAVDPQFEIGDVYDIMDANGNSQRVHVAGGKNGSQMRVDEEGNGLVTLTADGRTTFELSISEIREGIRKANEARKAEIAAYDEAESGSPSHGMSVTLYDGTTARVVKGDVSYDDKGNVDRKNSSSFIVVEDETGKRSVVHPRELSQVLIGEDAATDAETSAEQSQLAPTDVTEGVATEQPTEQPTEPAPSKPQQPGQDTRQPGVFNVGDYVVVDLGDGLTAEAVVTQKDEVLDTYVVMDEDAGRSMEVSGGSLSLKSTGQPAEQSTEQPAEQSTGQPAEQSTEQPAEQSTEQPAEQSTEQPAEQSAGQPAEQSTEQQSALERVPKDANGEPLFESVDAVTAYDAAVEMMGGDVQTAGSVISAQITQLAKELAATRKKQGKSTGTFVEMARKEKEIAGQIKSIEQRMAFWKNVGNVPTERANAAEEEAKRKAEEEAKRKAAEEAKRKAEEEAKRKAEEEAKRKAEEEAKRKAEEEAKRKAEEEAKRKAEEEAKRKAEEEAPKETAEEKRQKDLEGNDNPAADGMDDSETARGIYNDEFKNAQQTKKREETDGTSEGKDVTSQTPINSKNDGKQEEQAGNVQSGSAGQHDERGSVPGQAGTDNTERRGMGPGGSNEKNGKPGTRPGTRGSADEDTKTKPGDGGRRKRGSVGHNVSSGDRLRGGSSGGTEHGGHRDGAERGGNRESDDTRPSGRPDRVEPKGNPHGSEDRVPYKPKSKAPSVRSVMPAMQEEQLHDVLNDDVFGGDIDRYVTGKLGYKDKEELFSYLSAEQIEGVALAIARMESGGGFIIGDMTGVGKGRQGAAIIRYAVRQGIKPVFFTAKPQLFSDLYRDLVDIGSGDLRPFIFASSKEGAITAQDEDGEMRTIHDVPDKDAYDAAMKHIADKGSLPDEYDFVVATYSQVQAGTTTYSYGGRGDIIETRGSETAAAKAGQRRREAIKYLMSNSYVVLDEAHLAAGESNTGLYLQKALLGAKGVTFMSATYAKRPDNMPIYAANTGLALANLTPKELASAMEYGGVPLQEAVSQQLVRSGQMIRRERDFSDVSVDWMECDVANKEQQRRAYDIVSTKFALMYAYSPEKIAEEALKKADGDAKRRRLKCSVTPFSSILFPIFNQVVFGLKAANIAKIAIKSLKEGKKPVITFNYTSDSLFKELGKQTLPNDYAQALILYYKSMFMVPFMDKGGHPVEEVDLTQYMSAGEVSQYEGALRLLRAEVGIPLSPLDTIVEMLTKAGYKVGEISGRDMSLKSAGQGEVSVEKRKKDNSKKIAAGFNSGTIDVLMLNRSGSTGISLHASEKFSDQRPRVMISAQSQLDVNDEVQIRGRIDRTGQVERGSYTYITSHIPAEQRIQLMLRRKLKSLDANTTSSQKSSFSDVEDIPDIVNKYGDQVVRDFWQTNKAAAAAMGGDISDLDKVQAPAERFLKQLVFLDTDSQEAYFDEVMSAYKAAVERAKEEGSYDLEITAMDLKADVQRRFLVKEGRGESSDNMFAKSTYLDECEVDVVRKPLSSADLEKAIKAAQSETQREFGPALAAANEYSENKINELDGKIKEAKSANEKSALERKVGKVKEDIALLKQSLEEYDGCCIGQTATVTVGDEPTAGCVFLGLHMSKNFSPTTSYAYFAAPTWRRFIRVPISGMNAVDWWGYSGVKDTVDGWSGRIAANGSNTERERRMIIGGNLLEAAKTLSYGGMRARLISYTTKDGRKELGFLLPKNADTGKLQAPIQKSISEAFAEIKGTTSKKQQVLVSSSKAVTLKYKNHRGLRSVSITIKKTDGKIPGERLIRETPHVERKLTDYDCAVSITETDKVLTIVANWPDTNDTPGIHVEKILEELSRAGVVVDSAGGLQETGLDADKEAALALLEDIKRSPKKIVPVKDLTNLLYALDKDNEFSVLTNAIAGALKKSELNVIFAPLNGDTRGFFSKAGDLVVSSADVAASDNPLHPLLHELIHSVTSNAMSGYYDAPFRRADAYAHNYAAGCRVIVNKVWDFVITRAERPYYGNTSPGEMLAELSDKEYKAFLQSVPVWVTRHASGIIWRVSASEISYRNEDAVKTNAYDVLAECTSLFAQHYNIDVEKQVSEIIRQARVGGTSFNIRRGIASSSLSPEQRIEAARSVAADLQAEFGVEVEVVDSLDGVENADARKAIARGDVVKGWYEPSTGRVVLYAPNIEGEQDARATYAHEVIAHKGMRGLLGEERYSELCKRLGAVLTDEQLKRIEEYLGASSEVLGDEYIARIAEELIDEQGNIKEPTTWAKVKAIVRDFFRGLFGFNPTDADIRYMLWRSAERLRRGKADVFGRAQDVVTEQRIQAEVASMRSDESNDDIRFAIGRKRKEDMRKGLLNKLTNASEEDVERTINEIEKLGEQSKAGGDAKVEKAALHWVKKGSIILPEDGVKVLQAVKLAERYKVDVTEYDRPQQLIDEYLPKVQESERTDPDTVKTLTNKKVVGDTGITIYDVEDSEQGQLDMRQIINTHFGKDANPWCLLHGDGKGGLSTGEDGYDAKYYWKHYNKYPKRVAFKNGKLLAFFASDDEPTWWDRQDKPHEGIPVGGKIPGDELGRSATFIYDEAGDLRGMKDIYRGSRIDGFYEKWSDIDTKTDKQYHRNGVLLYEEKLPSGPQRGEKVYYDDNRRPYIEKYQTTNGEYIRIDKYDDVGRKIFRDVRQNGEKKMWDIGSADPIEITIDTQTGEIKEVQDGNGREAFLLTVGKSIIFPYDRIKGFSQAYIYKGGGQWTKLFGREISPHSPQINAQAVRIKQKAEKRLPELIIKEGRVRADARMREVLLDKEMEARQSFKSNLVGNSVDMSFNNEVGHPAEAGTQSVGETSSAKMKKKFEEGKYFLGKIASFFADIENGKVEGSNFIKDFIAALGRKDHGQSSEYISFAVGEKKIRLRLSSHSGNARNIIKKGVRADKGISVVLNIENSNDRDFRNSSWAHVDEFVYDNPTRADLVDITRGLFNLFDTGGYVDLAGATEPNVSPRAEVDGQREDGDTLFRSDPLADIIGEPYKQASADKAQRDAMTKAAQEAADKLGLDNVEILPDGSRFEGRKTRAKGFYSRADGKIYIIAGNNTSVADIMATLMHETVAHYGLRQLMGKQFDNFLDDVFNAASPAVRYEIERMAEEKYDGDIRTATEEYMASLAETTEFSDSKMRQLWETIKHLFTAMLRRVGLKDAALTDSDLRYTLWRSYRNLEVGAAHSNMLTEAEDIVAREAFAQSTTTERTEQDRHAEIDALFRDGDPEMHEEALVRDSYERLLRTGGYQSMEALRDSMQSLKEAMRLILGGDKKTFNIADVPGWQNAYLGENRMSSQSKAECDMFAHILFRPLLDAVEKLAKNADGRADLIDYMMAKHGLERNIYMANRDAQAAYDAYIKATPNGRKTLADFVDEYRKKDYAGLTALTGEQDVAAAEQAAQDIVDAYEQAHDADLVANLWDKTRAVNKAILDKQLECGMISKETYNKISDMYGYYIPLRGFDETTAEDMYAYIGGKQSPFNAPIKTARGRKSKADDPFANIQAMMESAIVAGNRNLLVKQRFLNFVLNHPSDLVSVSELWLQYDDINDEWVTVFPGNIDPDDSPADVAQKMEAFQQKMEQLAEAEPDKYKKGKQAANIPYRTVRKSDRQEHFITARANGREYLMVVNGNPRLAQALNGQTNPDSEFTGAAQKVADALMKLNRSLSLVYTTLSPDFMISNFCRDMIYSNVMAHVKNDGSYGRTWAAMFHVNCTTGSPVAIGRLLAKMRKGKLDFSDKDERLFYEFIMNGGETGYIAMRDIETRKNEMQRELRRSRQTKAVIKGLDMMWQRYEEAMRAVELTARFAAYKTSRNMGRTIDRSIFDAKEISVNFNKKGAGSKFLGAKGQTTLGNIAAFTGGIGRMLFVFWDASVQGMANFWGAAKYHKAKATLATMLTPFVCGFMQAFINEVLQYDDGDGDDDDDKDKTTYWDLPEHVRRDNIVIWAKGNNYITIPLPVEFRAFWGLGELAGSIFNTREKPSAAKQAKGLVSQLTQMLPVDVLEGKGTTSLVPSAFKPIVEAYALNQSWAGYPVTNRHEWNENLPEWTKAYKGTSKVLIAWSKALNEATGGDDYTKGWIEDGSVGKFGLWVNNPAQVEYVLNGYLGGLYGTFDKTLKTASGIANSDFNPRTTLLVNRLWKQGDGRTAYRSVGTEYYKIKEEAAETKRRFNAYKTAAKGGALEYAEKINALYYDEAYRRYLIYEKSPERKAIDKLNKIKKTIPPAEKEKIDEINKTINQLKGVIVERVREYEKGKDK